MHDAGILYEGCRVNSGTTGTFSRNEGKREKYKKAYEELLSPKSQRPKEVQLLLVEQANCLPGPKQSIKPNNSSVKAEQQKSRHAYANHRKNYPWLFPQKPKNSSLTGRNFGRAEYEETRLPRKTRPPTVEEIAAVIAKCPSKKAWVEAWRSITYHPYLSFSTFFESLSADEELLANARHSPA